MQGVLPSLAECFPKTGKGPHTALTPKQCAFLHIQIHEIPSASIVVIHLSLHTYVNKMFLLKSLLVLCTGNSHVNESLSVNKSNCLLRVISTDSDADVLVSNH